MAAHYNLWLLHHKLLILFQQWMAIWVLSNTTITIQFFQGIFWPTTWNQYNFLAKIENNVTSTILFDKIETTIKHQWNLSLNWTRKSMDTYAVMFLSGFAHILKNFSPRITLNYIREAQILWICTENHRSLAPQLYKVIIFKQCCTFWRFLGA